MSTPDCLYYNADGTIMLCRFYPGEHQVEEDIAVISAEDAERIHCGEAEYRVTSREFATGDGDTFFELEPR